MKQPTNQPPSGMTPDNIEGHLNAFRDGYNAATVVNPSGLQEIKDKYKHWCTDTKRNGAVLVGGSINEFFDWIYEATPPPQPLGIEELINEFYELYRKHEIDPEVDETPYNRGVRVGKYSTYATVVTRMRELIKAGYAASPQSRDGVNKKMKEAIETLLTGIEYFASEHSADYVITTPDIFMLKDAVSSAPQSRTSLSSAEEAIGERKFTLKEALEIWDESGNYHSTDGFMKDSPDKVQYFKQRFNIKLP